VTQGSTGGAAGRFPTVRRVGPRDVRRLSAALATAFIDDPVSAYLFAAERHRRRRLERYFRFQLRSVFLPMGEAYATEGLRAGALWIPPRQYRPPTLAEAVSQLPIALVLGSGLGRGVRLVELLESRHPRIPHYYLGTIGTAPELQGRGHGSALLRTVLGRCDAEGIPAYLESSKESNNSFYSRHGFAVVDTVALEGTEISLWLMWREPLPPGTREHDRTGLP
ncbi:MAG: GNAT family N-acetyltransferase, partial [Acidimicrobiales bacterium]